MKDLLIKLRLIEEKIESTFEDKKYQHQVDFTTSEVVDKGWYQVALKHYCGTCERWFSDVRGLLMHNRHNHKPV